MKTYIFADTHYLWHAGAKYGSKFGIPFPKVDYERLLDGIVRRVPGRLERAIAYVNEHPHYDARKFIDMMEMIGWTVYRQQLIIHDNKRVEIPRWNVKITVDALMTAMDSDSPNIVICSGDGQLMPTCEALSRLGATVYVVGFRGATSNDLQRAWTFYPITHKDDDGIRAIFGDDESKLRKRSL